MLSPELLQKVQNIFIRSSHKVTEVFAGEYESAFRGRGIEFEEYREYSPGDDIRQIDWKVTARMDKPFVKIFREEREQTIFFLVDSSRSLLFGRNKEKLEVATEVAALLSYTAIRSNDKVGLIIFSDQIEAYIPPKKGRGHVWNIIATLLSHSPKGRKTDIKAAIHFFLKVTNRKTVCFLISDFFDEGYRDSLRVAAIRHEFVAIRILDSLEKKIPKGALMDFEDLESGERLSLDLGTRGDWVEKHQKEVTKNLSDFFGTHRVDFLDIAVDENYVDALLRFFIRREKKR